MMVSLKLWAESFPYQYIFNQDTLMSALLIQLVQVYFSVLDANNCVSDTVIQISLWSIMLPILTQSLLVMDIGWGIDGNASGGIQHIHFFGILSLEIH